MSRDIQVGAMLKVPVETLGQNYKELIDLLTVPNPEAKQQAFFGSKFAQNKVPAKLTFYALLQAEKCLLLPRNIERKYFLGDTIFDYSGLSQGEEISQGHSKEFSLRSGQAEFFNNTVLPYIYNNIDNDRKDILSNLYPIDLLCNAECGAGKCHGKGTEILMFDGSIKKVEDVKVGDLLMGDDSTPRKVLSLARGTEQLYEIIQKNGENYIVNESHILSLQNREWGAGKGTKRGKEAMFNYGSIKNISITDYLTLPKTRKSWLYGYSKPAIFPEKELLIDPYFVGLWLGDGTKRTVTITTDPRDVELIDYYYEVANKFELGIREEYNSENSNNYHFTNGRNSGKNPILEILRHYDLMGNKHIPEDFIVNSKENRLKLLAGFIDTDGSIDKKSFEIIQKSDILAEDLKRLCWSLGYKVTHRPKFIKGIKYNRLTIKGNELTEIPTKLPRKKIEPREINKDASVTSIKVVKREVGEYYGFTIDGNHLYQLKDGTVTHNTVMALYLASLYRRKTLIVTTVRKIGEQFIETVNNLFPDWTVGWEDGKTDYDITIATYALMSKDNYHNTYFSKFGHIIFDEYHRAGAGSYNIILAKAPCQYRTTLTATFRRKDNLHKILKLHIGNILEMKRSNRKATIYPIFTKSAISEIEFRSVDREQTRVATLEELEYEPERLAKLNRLDLYMEVCVKGAKDRKEKARGSVVEIDYTQQPPMIKIQCEIEYKMKEFYANEVTFNKLGILAITSIDTEIVENERRNEIVLELLRWCKPQNRTVLILSKRKDILYKLYYRLTRYGFKPGIVVSEKSKDYIDFCKSIGRTVKDNRDYAFTEAKVILGIDKLAEEGMDVPHLDTVIYLHPISDIEQSIGRSTRELANKPESLGFYLRDNITPYEKNWSKKGGARDMFKSLGHEVKSDMTIDEFLNNN